MDLAIAINPDGTDMDLNIAMTKINNNGVDYRDFRYVIRQVPYTGSS